jgi:isoleucyl-tRNA synthetase
VKSSPAIYPRIHVTYSPSYPLLAPIIINLPSNGLRLRFDGPEQRLRLIEVLDFSKSHITYKGHDISKAGSHSTSYGEPANRLADQLGQLSIKTGPPFRTIYKIFGPTTPGEYVSPEKVSPDTPSAEGTYILSYPGIAFSFPLQAGCWSPSTGWASIVSLLSSSATGSTTSLSIFLGESWTTARSKLFSSDIPGGVLRSPIPTGLRKENMPKEVDIARVYDRGRIELVRKDAPNFWLILGETTPQDLVTELGPPDTIHKKKDRRVSIHRPRKGSAAVESRRGSSTSAVHVDVGRTSPGYVESDPSSRAVSSDSEDEDDEGDHITVDGKKNSTPEQIFYNYYSHGFDILIGSATTPSFASPTADPHPEPLSRTNSMSSTSQANLPIPNLPETPPVLPRSHLTATKMIFHGNVPGSWTFNRHRRLQWTLESVPETVSDGSAPLTSETSWKDVQHRLQKVFREHYSSPEEARLASLPMVVNRGWGREEAGTDSEWGVVGGWEDGGGAGTGSVVKKGEGSQDETEKLGAAEVYGFPGLVFEVLKNGAVSSLMVY